VWQTFEGLNGEANTSASAILSVFTPASPQVLNAAGVLTSSQDTKVYIEKASAQLRVINSQNYPVVCRLVYFRVKKNIPISTYPTLSTLLADGTPTLTGLATGDFLTSNAAQRYLKWTKFKTKVLYTNRLLMFSVKQKLRKFTTGDIEGNIGFIGYRGMTGCILWVDGVPVEGASGGQVAPGPVAVEMTVAYKISYRTVDNSTNTSVLGTAYNTLPGFGNVVVPAFVDGPIIQE